MTCEHVKHFPPVNENMYPRIDEPWNLMDWEGTSLKVNMCEKCHLLYWEE